jgi:hypothetical protein
VELADDEDSNDSKGALEDGDVGGGEGRMSEAGADG